MGSSKFDIERFTSKNDFVLWRVKMKAILFQKGAVDELREEEDLPKMLTKKGEIAYSIQSS